MWIQCKRGILVFSLGLLSPLFLYAQQAATEVQTPLRFDRLSIEDGLSQNDVFTILQDRRGFMWFGTNFGLNRYDGYAFTLYKTAPFDAATLSYNWILALHEDRDGKLWVGTTHGLNRMAPSTGTVTRYLHDPNDPGSLSHDEVWAIHEDRAGTLWVGTSGGLNKRDGGANRFTPFRHDPTDAHSLSSDIVYALHEDPTGTLWVSTANGLNRLDPDKPGHFTRYLHDPGEARTFRNDIIHGIAAEPGRRKNVIRHLCDDPVEPGILWVSTESGLLRFDTETGRHLRYLPDPDDPEANTVMDVVADPVAAGVLWLTTNGGGLYRFDTRTEQFTPYRHDPMTPASISSNKLFPLYTDRTGLLWVGSFGEGVNKVYPALGSFTHYRHVPGDPGSLSHNGVWAFQEDRSGAVWIGTNDGLNRFDPDASEARFTRYFHDPNDPHSLSGSNINALLVDRAGTLWVGLYPGGLNRLVLSEVEGSHRERDRFIHYRHDPHDSTTLSNDYPSFILEDRARTLWIGTWGAGLNKLDRATGRFTHYRHDPNDSTSLSSDHIMQTMFEDAAGTLWIGTNAGLNRFDAATETFTRYEHDPRNPNSLNHPAVYCIYERAREPGVLWLATTGGLNRLDTRTGLFTHFTEKNGLPSNRLLGILEDAAGRLWLSTANGLSRFDPETGDIRNYDVDRGLQSREFNPGAYFKRAGGELFFGGINGFNAFYPNRIADHPVPPPVVISGFKLFNEPVTVGSDSPLEQPLAETETIRLKAGQKVFTFEFVALHYLNSEKNQYAHQLEGFDEDWVMDGTRRTTTYTNLDPGAYTFRVKASNSDGVWNEEGASIKIVIAPPWWQTRWAYGLYALLLVVGVFAVDRVQRRRLIRQEQEKARIREARIKTQAAEERARSLQELDHMKSRFFVNVSHEFRTPLTLLLGPLHDALDGAFGGLDDRLRTQLTIMQQSGARLLRLINQLLDLSRLEAGRLELRARRTDLVPFLRSLVAAFVSHAERQHIMFQFTTEQEALDLYFDPDKLEQVFVNLLSNAFKFTPEGGKIRVSVAEGADEAGAYVEVAVKDTGRGIAADELSHIFDRFHQIDASSTRENEGMGIGLALARELVVLHAGEIRVASEPGFGSTFFVQLRKGKDHLDPGYLVEARPTAAAVVEGERAFPALEASILYEASKDDEVEGGPSEDAPTILVVEDNADMRAYLASCLGGRYHVLEAEDGRQGLEQIRASHPALVISDVMMPGMDGYELCRALKTDEKLNDIPVILLTARADEESKVEGLETGADDYLYKPFRVAELLARAENLIEIRRLLRQRFSGEVLVQPTAVAVSSEEAVFLERVRTVVEQHLSETNFGVDRLADEVGISKRQLQRRLRAATALSAAGYIRTMRLMRAAQLLEQQIGTISEVAYAVGFRDAKHFSKLFQQTYGVLPSRYGAETV